MAARTEASKNISFCDGYSECPFSYCSSLCRKALVLPRRAQRSLSKKNLLFFCGERANACNDEFVYCSKSPPSCYFSEQTTLLPFISCPSLSYSPLSSSSSIYTSLSFFPFCFMTLSFIFHPTNYFSFILSPPPPSPFSSYSFLPSFLKTSCFSRSLLFFLLLSFLFEFFRLQVFNFPFLFPFISSFFHSL